MLSASAFGSADNTYLELVYSGYHQPLCNSNIITVYKHSTQGRIIQPAQKEDMHRQIKDWSTWTLQKLIWLTANSFSRLNITRLDCHNNTPFQNQYVQLRGTPRSEQKAIFLISRLLQQDHYKFDSGMTVVELLFPLIKTQFFRSCQAIVSFGIKLADLETFNKFWHRLVCSWAELNISNQEKVVDFVKNNSR